MLGIARTEQGAVPEGIGMLRQAMQTTQAIRVESGISAMHLMIADAALKSGLIREGLDAIDHGFARASPKTSMPGSRNCIVYTRRTTARVVSARSKHQGGQAR